MKNHSYTFTRNFANIRRQSPNKNSRIQLKRLKTETNQPLSNQANPIQSITITNKESKYKLNFGEQFKDFLEPRDQVLEHQFDFSIPFDEEKDLATVRDQQVPSQILKKVKQFLVESTSNVTSAAFKFLCKGDLTEEEAKEYASKNILLNINAIFRQTVNSICQHIAQREQGEMQKADRFELMKQNFAIDVDNMMNEILVNLADNYPQAPAAGETPRMREAIIDLNRMEDEENDLIFANKIKIYNHLKIKRDKYGNQLIDLSQQEGDYTKFIMEVINTAIKVTQSSQEDYKDRTVKQIFTEFNQKLFFLSQEQNYQKILNDSQSQKKNSNKNNKDLLIEQEIVDCFDQSLQRNKKNIEAMTSFVINNINSLQDKKAQLDQLQEQIILNRRNSTIPLVQTHQNSKFSEINFKEKFQKLRQKGQKNNKNHKIGQKIPSLVKQFTKQQMENAIFTSKHSSILRILTKWAEYLQQIFENPQKSILERMYPFKTIQNQLVILNHSQSGDAKLIMQLHKQYQEVKIKSELITKSCYSFMSQFLSKSEHHQSNVERYAETRANASKINAVLTSLMLRYTNTLIHHLIKAGQQIRTDRTLKNINLVVFRVSDLLRAKLQCNESSFISLLKTMYILDNSEIMKDKFKLVRIKNKLDDPANNIMINYLFMGKVQCQLQLSIQQPQGKTKNYYIFSHFIYELTRGKFGVITECATMISQLDPMIYACKGSYYKEKKGRKICNISSASKSADVQSSFDDFERNVKSSIFQCVDQKCKRLVINESRQIFNKEKKSMCNRCIINSEKPEKQLNDELLKSHIHDNRYLERINNFSSLSNLKQRSEQFAFKCLAILNDRGKLTFNLAMYNSEEFKTFLLRLSSAVIQQVGTPDFNFDSLDYTDITKTIKEDEKYPHQSKQLMYVISDVLSCPQQLFSLMKLSKSMVLEKLNHIVKEFQEFRLEKNMILSIRFKAGIITTNFNLDKWNRLGNVVTAFQNQNVSQQILRYKKQKHLDLSTIKQIYARHMQLVDLPDWLLKLNNLRILSMDENKLTKIALNQLPSTLTRLIITDNQLSQANLSNLQNISFINLSKNQLSFIDISRLSSLNELRIANNKLQQICFSSFQEINNQIVQNIPFNLKFLILSDNNFKQIDLSMLHCLIKINLNKNKLTTINLVNLSNLKELRLSDNQLAQIDLSCLINLTFLDLTKNYLEIVNLQNLKLLKQIYLWCNKIANIDVSNQNKLTKLSIRSNPQIKIVKTLPASLVVLTADRSTVINYDFKELKILKEIAIKNGKTAKEELMNLRGEVIVTSEDT